MDRRQILHTLAALGTSALVACASKSKTDTQAPEVAPASDTAAGADAATDDPEAEETEAPAATEGAGTEATTDPAAAPEATAPPAEAATTTEVATASAATTPADKPKAKPKAKKKKKSSQKGEAACGEGTCG